MNGINGIWKIEMLGVYGWETNGTERPSCMMASIGQVVMITIPLALIPSMEAK